MREPALRPILRLIVANRRTPRGFRTTGTQPRPAVAKPGIRTMPLLGGNFKMVLHGSNIRNVRDDFFGGGLVLCRRYRARQRHHAPMRLDVDMRGLDVLRAE